MGSNSTIVACLEAAPTLLRPGAIAREAIEAVLQAPVAVRDQPERIPNAPGQLQSHYAPRARLRLEAGDAASDEAALDFAGALAGAAAAARLDLSPSGDLVEAASQPLCLSARSRRNRGGAHCGRPGSPPRPGVAINDRLRRAAAPREA